MPYFNRLTDIVTCSITALLEGVDDPASALQEIIGEMKEGVAGAERSALTASKNCGRIESEIREQRDQIAYWVESARQQLSSGKEDAARQSLFRKREVADLIAALEEQLRAACATRDHLTTTLHALQARLSDAERRLAGFVGGETSPRKHGGELRPGAHPADDRDREVDAELEELRRGMSLT